MKTINKIALMAIVIMTTATIVFVACKKEEAEIAKTQKTVAISIEQKTAIDSISREIAYYHNYLLDRFLINMYEEGDSLTDQYLLQIINYVLNEGSNCSFTYLNADYFNEDSINVSNIADICNIILSNNTFSLQLFSDYNFNNLFSVPLIENSIIEISTLLENSFYNSNTYEAFEASYLLGVSELLEDVSDENDYFCIRVCADVALNSFYFWTNYFYLLEQHQKEGNWWDKVKAKAQEVWNEVKPYVAADVGGAVAGLGTGLYTGAAAGSVVLPGAGTAIGGAGGAGSFALVCGVSASAGASAAALVEKL